MQDSHWNVDFRSRTILFLERFVRELVLSIIGKRFFLERILFKITIKISSVVRKRFSFCKTIHYWTNPYLYIQMIHWCINISAVRERFIKEWIFFIVCKPFSRNWIVFSWNWTNIYYCRLWTNHFINESFRSFANEIHKILLYFSHIWTSFLDCHFLRNESLVNGSFRSFANVIYEKSYFHQNLKNFLLWLILLIDLFYFLKILSNDSLQLGINEDSIHFTKLLSMVGFVQRIIS